MGSWYCISNFLFLPTAPPSIVVHPSAVVVEASKTAELVCIAHGIPAPSITWSRTLGTGLQNRPVIHEEIIDINGTAFTVSVLEFCSVDVTDNDQYNCTAINGEAGGSDASAVFNLTVLDIIKG